MKWIDQALRLPPIIERDRVSPTIMTLLSSAICTNPIDFHKKPDKLPPGFHFCLFPSATTENQLSTDGYTQEHAPPQDLYPHRVWGGGKFTWMQDLRIGDTIQQHSKIKSIEKKGLDDKLFVEIEKTIFRDDSEALFQEQRTLVYLTQLQGREKNWNRQPRRSNALKPDYSYSFTPTKTTLFRYSALTYNAHKIHLDSEYARNVELLPDCLVHGPLTCTLLLLHARDSLPSNTVFKSFSYRAISPLFVNRPIKMNMKITGSNSCELWAEDELESRIGMKGTLIL